MKTISLEKQSALSHERLLDLLHYDPETGIMTWKKNRRGAAVAGRRAGTLRQSGYYWVAVEMRQFALHRLAWFYMTGAWPPAQVDHINRVKADNRFVNLRLASAVENSNNKPMGLGVKRHGRKFQAWLRVGAKKVYLGSFGTEAEAHATYKEARALKLVDPSVIVSASVSKSV